MARGPHITEQLGLVGGVNLLRDPRALSPYQSALAKNLFPITQGVLAKRPGIQATRMAVYDSSGGVNKFIPLDFAVIPNITGYPFLAHFHKFADTSTNADHELVASAFDNESSSLTNSIVKSLGPSQSDYEPLSIIPYRGVVICIVPGLEGFWQLCPNGTGDSFEWVKVSFVHASMQPDGQSSQEQAISVTPRLGAAYKNRMVYANFGPNMGNWLTFADRVATTYDNVREEALWSVVGNDVLSFNSRHVELAQITGEYIRAMQEITLASTGAQVDTLLLVLTDKSCVMLSGEILETSDSGAVDQAKMLGDLDAHKVNFECGCVGQKTLVKTPYGYVWASQDDVWILDGNVPRRIGTNIRPALTACPGNEKQYWSAGYADGVYVLSLVTTPTTTLAYTNGPNTSTYIHQQWWLDLRDGAPGDARAAQWYGPMEILNEEGSSLILGPITSYVDTDGAQRIIGLAYHDNENDTFLLDYTKSGDALDQPVAGFSSANLWQAATAQAVGSVVRATDSASNYYDVTGRFYVCTQAGTTDSSEPAWPTDSSEVTDGSCKWQQITNFASKYPLISPDTAFQIDLRSRDAGLNDVIYEKLLRRVDVNVQATNKMNLYGYSMNNQGIEVDQLGPATVGGLAQRLGIMELSAMINSGEAETRSLRPAETALVKGRQFQIKLQDSTAYIIDDSNDHIIFGSYYFDGATTAPMGLTPYLQVALTQGEYANMDALLDHVVTQLNGKLNELTGMNVITPYINGWSKTSAYSGGFPYCSRLNLHYALIDPVAVGHGFIHANTDADSINPALVAGDNTSVLYLSRSKALLTLLGFDTDMRFFQGNAISTEGAVPADTYATLFSTIADPLHFDGVQIVQFKNSVRFALVTAAKVEEGKPATPFQGSNRS